MKGLKNITTQETLSSIVDEIITPPVYALLRGGAVYNKLFKTHINICQEVNKKNTQAWKAAPAYSLRRSIVGYQRAYNSVYKLFVNMNKITNLSI